MDRGFFSSKVCFLALNLKYDLSNIPLSFLAAKHSSDLVEFLAPQSLNHWGYSNVKPSFAKK